MGHTAAPDLMIVTLVAALLIGIAALVWHLRKPSNRHPMEHQRERNIDEMRRGEPPKRDTGVGGRQQ